METYFLRKNQPSKRKILEARSSEISQDWKVFPLQEGLALEWMRYQCGGREKSLKLLHRID